MEFEEQLIYFFFFRTEFNMTNQELIKIIENDEFNIKQLEESYKIN